MPEGHKTAAFAAADWALLASVALIWGSSFLFIEVAVDHLRPPLIATLRLAFGVATLAAIPSARRPVPRSDWGAVGLVGVVWMAGPFLLFPVAQQWIDSSLAGMLNGAAPLFTAAIAAVVARRLPGGRQQVGLLLGAAGVVVVSLPSIAGARATPLGVGLVLFATLLYGIAVNLTVPLQRKHGALPVIWRAEMAALAAVTPFGLASVRGSSFAWPSVLAVGALGCLGTALAFVAFTSLVGRVGATRAAVSAYFLPPVAILLGALVRHEPIAAISIGGTLLITAGAFLAGRADRSLALPAARLAKVAGVALALFLCRPASAQDRNRVWPLPRLHGPIRLDGRSDDPAWQDVPPLPMTVYLPAYGSQPTERTVARVAYDDEALYVVVDAWEAHPGGVRASTMIRDDDAPGDFINVLLDTFGDHQNAVGFSATPGGNRNDWTISGDAQSYAGLSAAWDAPWDLATRRGPDGWHAEFRIPFSTLRFAPRDGRVEFGLSVNRLAAHVNERVTFPAIEPTAALALWKPSAAQRVSLEGVRVPRAVRLTPYAVAGLEGARSPDPLQSPWEEEGVVEAGGDLKVALTPSLTLDLTANTDFAETEVDDQRVNLTRFPLLYPERRQFFLERAGTFEVRTGELDLLFNSRRVGLSPGGEPVRLLGGVRLVGQVRGWDVGLFDAQTGRTPAGIRENLGVLRVRHAVVNPRSWIGLTMTSRAAPDSNQAAFAVDGAINLGGDDYASFALAQLAGDAVSGTERGLLPRGALRLVVERRRNRGVWYRAGLASTGARYTPALGYVERLDAVQPGGEVGYGRVVSRAGHALRANLTTQFVWHNTAASLEGWGAGASVALELPGGTVWTVAGARAEEELLMAFAPTPETSVPAGRYTAVYGRLTLTPATGPRAVLGASIRAGDYYDGSLYSVTVSPEWRASAHLRLASEVQLDRLEFARRREREWSLLARLRILASATPRLSMSAAIQANSLAHLASANLRVRYNLREGHDLWVVYGHDQNLDRARATPPVPATARAALTVKYAHSFGR